MTRLMTKPSEATLHLIRLTGRSVVYYRLRHDHGLGGAGGVGGGPAAVPRALAPLLPPQPLPHVAAGARAAQVQRVGPELPHPLVPHPPPGAPPTADRTQGTCPGRRTHAPPPLNPSLSSSLPPSFETGSFLMFAK